ncbi:hypothetical protein CGZ69_08230 [Streptomyces peucetius subsp. caesius ATCC 27952]|nr:hypothetical protein CGZ69_08230 [Streptomyces peucetius subsp. caesius ATCC 27952]
MLVSSVGSPDEATRCPLAVSSMAPVASPDLPPFPERGKTSPASKGGLAIRQAGIGSAVSDIRNGGMRDTPCGQPSRIQS